MNAALDTAKAVLAKASLFDQTFARPDLGIAVAWAEALGTIDRDDALIVVTAHYANEARRIMPADVKRGVAKLRAERLRAYGNSEPDYDGDDVAGGLEAIRAHRRAVAEGRITEAPRQIGNGSRSGVIAEMLKDAGKRWSVPR